MQLGRIDRVPWAICRREVARVDSDGEYNQRVGGGQNRHVENMFFCYPFRLLPAVFGAQLDTTGGCFHVQRGGCTEETQHVATELFFCSCEVHSRRSCGPRVVLTTETFLQPGLRYLVPPERIVTYGDLTGLTVMSAFEVL